MALRKSIVFFGAVLVLAACDRATAPTGPLSQHQGSAASVRKTDTTTRTTITTQAATGEGGGCVWYKDGSDSVSVCSPDSF